MHPAAAQPSQQTTHTKIGRLTGSGVEEAEDDGQCAANDEELLFAQKGTGGP